MVRIRKAKRSDVPFLEKLDLFGNQLNRYSGLDRLDPNIKEEPGKKSYYEKFILGKKKWCLVAEEDKILGFILFNIEKRPSYFKVKEVGYIDLLYVDKKARAQGISKLLMKKAREILKAENIKHLKLSVHSDNPAKKVWEKYGFKEYSVDIWRRL